MQEPQRLLSSAGIMLTTDGQRHLGAPIGTSNFCVHYAAEKVTKWCNEPHRFADIAKAQPDAAYSTFTLSISIVRQYTYFMRTIRGMHEFIKPVDDVIRLELFPALLNSIVLEVDRQL